MDDKQFFEEIYEMVSSVPEGYVVTYGQLAKAAGRPKSARHVGFAMKNAPDGGNIPCHRVVNGKGELAAGHVFGDKSLQRIALEAEGVKFLENNRIDMKKCIWEFL